MRGGRFSRTIRLELPDAEARLAILRIETRRMPTVGVDLEELCQQAALRALVRTHDDGPGDDAATVTRDDVARAITDRREGRGRDR